MKYEKIIFNNQKQKRTNKMKSLFNLLFIALLATSLISCSNNNTDEKSEVETNLIKITKEQFKAEKMQLGNSQKHLFNITFKTNGTITASPKSKSDVYSYFSGTIQKINVAPGNYVHKGEILLSVASKGFLDLQKQYLESIAQLKAMKAEYKRVNDLYKDNIASEKELLETESKYFSQKAETQALKAELKIVKLDLNNLEKGNIVSFLNVKSPSNGYVTNMECNTGQYITPETMLMKVIDNNNLQLNFYVYQETVENLRKGQKVKIYTAHNSHKKYSAKIFSIGKAIDPATKSILCLAIPEKRIKNLFVDGMYFQVDVVTDTLSAQALPTNAIIKSGDEYYVLVKVKEDGDNLFFKKMYVKPGISDEAFTQISENRILKNVLVKGAYYF